MRAVVTGGAGFIGSHVAERLRDAGHTVLVIDDLSGGFEDNIPRSVEFARVSIMSDMINRLFTDFRPELVYHLAAYAAEGLSPHIPVHNYTNNLVGTANVLAAAHRAGAKHFVFTSSMAVYGHGHPPFNEADAMQPCDPYGLAKAACEQHIELHHAYYGGPDFTIIRPHNVYGPRQNIVDPYRNVVGIFMRCALEGKSFPIFGDGTQARSFSYIDQTAEVIAAAPFTPAARGAVVNVGAWMTLTIRELATKVARIFEVPDVIESRPPRVEVHAAHSDHGRMHAIFPDIAPDIALDAGLRKMAAWVRSRPIPQPTRAPAIEIMDRLPPAWRP